MALPQADSREAWLAARRELLIREKELIRAGDVLSADRRRLPMVRVQEDYRFTGPEGEVGLLDLFGSHRQLIVQHFMFDPTWQEGCSSCTAMAAELGEGVREHLGRRSTAFAAVSRAPYDKIRSIQRAKKWSFP